MDAPAPGGRAPALRAALALFVLATAGLGAPARGRELPVSRLSLPLPGAPSELLPADLDGDGRRDLLLFVAWSSWGEVGVEEEVRLDETRGLIEVMTVVPALLDRRELRLYRGVAEGGLSSSPLRLEVGPGLHALAVGTSFAPVVALTDDGVAAVRLTATAAGEPALALEPLLAEPSVLTGTDIFLSGLAFVGSVDGAGEADLLVPVDDGVAIHLSGGGRFEPATRVALPMDDPRAADGRLVRHYPIPQRRDLDGDGRPELLVMHPRRGWNEAQALSNLGAGRFAAPAAVAGGLAYGDEGGGVEADGKGRRDVVFLGDLDGDGRAEALTASTSEPGDDASLRENLDAARRPRVRFGVHALSPESGAASIPRVELATVGHFIGEGEEVGLPGGLQDLDGDGRLDLVTMTLDFSVLQAARVLATKRVSIGVDFLVHCQTAAGAFRRVEGLDLGGKFQLDLDDLRIGRLSQFAGDFDGDGRLDFLQLGRGRRASVHLGRAGCAYRARPDFELDLIAAPIDLQLTRVADWNGDGRADLAIVRPEGTRRGAVDGADSGVVVDLYLSSGRGGR